MKIYLGSDHRGFILKNKVFAYLAKRGYEVFDEGDQQLNPDDDFPQFAQAAALKILDGSDVDRAILTCGSGQGMAIAANRFSGIRAIVVDSVEEARYGRNDDDANVLCLPARVLTDNDALWQNIIDAFLDTEFSGAPRFVRRNRELDELS